MKRQPHETFGQGNKEIAKVDKTRDDKEVKEAA